MIFSIPTKCEQYHELQLGKPIEPTYLCRNFHCTAVFHLNQKKMYGELLFIVSTNT